MTRVPNGQYFGTASVRLPASPHTKPMPSVINSMGRIKGRLEDHACGDFARQVIIACLSRSGSSIIVQIFLTKGVSSVGTNTGATGCRLELARTLPFRAARKPQHEPVVRIVLLGEVGREEESYMGLGVS